MKYILFLFIFVSCLNINSQILSDLDSDFFQLRVKTPDEFIRRFNYEQTPNGETLKYNDSLKTYRVKYIQSLFDYKLLEKAQKNDSISNSIFSFINQVAVDSTHFLSYYSKGWSSEVNCITSYQGEKHKIKLILKTENTKNNSKWVIDSCSSVIFNIQPKDSMYFIGPANHNLNFMELLKMSKFHNKSASSFKSNRYKNTNIAILFFLIQNKLLTIDSIKNIIFHFYQVPGFYFKVENVKRESSNSGWLITEIKNMKFKK